MRDKYYESLRRLAKDALQKLHPEERKAIGLLLHRQYRRRPERLKLKTLRVEAESARGLRPILIAKGNAKLIVHGHNPERVTLGSVGDLDFYCYPNIWSDRVFIGLYPDSVQIEDTNMRQLFACVMRTYWALKTGMRSRKIKQILLNKSRFKARKTLKTQIGGKSGAKKSHFD